MQHLGRVRGRVGVRVRVGVGVRVRVRVRVRFGVRVRVRVMLRTFSSAVLAFLTVYLMVGSFSKTMSVCTAPG